MKSVAIPTPDDWHVHLRDGALLRAVAPVTARHFARAVVMPNLQRPVKTTQDAAAYRDRIRSALPEGSRFEPLMTAYLADDTVADDLRRGWGEKVLSAVKLYPAGATTHSQFGVSSVGRIRQVLEVLQELRMPLLVHGEVTDPHVDVFDRERVFLENVVAPMLREHPALRVVLEHVTTREAVEFVFADDSGRLAATITPQHLMLNRNAMFRGGFRPHSYCLPVLKREEHRLALRRAATSGDRRFFLGTDSAPHDRRLKEAACGCAGIFNAPVALGAYATVFEEEGALDKLAAFAGQNGPSFYGLPVNAGHLTLVKSPQAVPDEILYEEGRIVPFLAGEAVAWSVAGAPATVG